MSMRVVVGAGPVGTATARLLAARGDRVRLVSRRGAGPHDPAIELVRADAADVGTLSSLAAGAATLFQCAAPPYWRWPAEFPALSSAVLGAAEATGAVLVQVGNLYGYGPVDGPITEELALSARGPKGRVRARLWAEALELHQAGRIRVTEAGPRTSSEPARFRYSPTWC